MGSKSRSLSQILIKSFLHGGGGGGTFLAQSSSDVLGFLDNISVKCDHWAKEKVTRSNLS